MSRRLEIAQTAAGAAGIACDLISGIAPNVVALSGGESPVALYKLLRERNVLASSSIWQVDERCVPMNSPESNGATIAAIFSGGVREIHRVPCQDPPEEAARVYQDEICALLGEEPVFDLMVMGLGQDGHTASLFPGSPELDERRRVVVATDRAHDGSRRVSLTLPVINRARAVVFLVTGATRAAAFARIQEGELLPGGRVLGATWVLDRAAAAPPQSAVARRRRHEEIEGQQRLFEL